MARILFVTHEATRTGAVIQLLDTLRWLRANTRHELTTLMLRGGDLVPDFEAVGPVVKVFALTEPPLVVRGLRKLLGRQPPSALDRVVAQLQRQAPFDLLYANTTVSGVAMGALRGLARRGIAHVHEMPTLIASLQPAAVEAIRAHADRVVVPSAAVARGLGDELNFDAARISVLYGFTASASRLKEPCDCDRQRVRQVAGLPTDAWVLGVCGSGSVVKGSDLLPRLAQALPAELSRRPVYLAHVGGIASLRERLFIERDARLLGVGARLRLLGPSTTPAALMAGFDVHLLPSREDSFPLVVLEAAELGIPTVCFEGAGGATEFCATGTGLVVPYLDVQAMAAAACDLLAAAEKRHAMGAAARAKWMHGHRIEAAMPRWLEIVERELAAR
jgi:glycosyltransferase involved in cell wall biosynthesis